MSAGSDGEDGELSVLITSSDVQLNSALNESVSSWASALNLIQPKLEFRLPEQLSLPRPPSCKDGSPLMQDLDKFSSEAPAPKAGHKRTSRSKDVPMQAQHGVHASPFQSHAQPQTGMLVCRDDGRFHVHASTKDSERLLAEETSLLAPLLGVCDSMTQLTPSHLMEGIADGQVRRHCEDREQEVRALRARVAALEAALLDKTRAGQHTTGVGGRVSAGGGHPDAMGTLGVGQREAGQSELLRAADSAQPNDAMDIEELCLSRPSQDKDQLLDTPTPTATPAATRGASPLSEEGWSDGGGEEEWWGCKRARISDFMGMCLGAEGGEGAGAAGAGVGVGGDDGDCGALVEAQQHPLMVQSGVHQVPDPLAPWLFAPSSPLPPLAPSPLLPLQQPQEPLPPAGAPCMPGAPALPSLSLGPTSQCPRSNLTATPNTPHTATLNNAGIPTPFSPALWGAQQQQQPAAPTLAREGVSAFSQCATAPSPPQSTAAPSRHDSNTPGAPPLCGPSHHRLGPEAVAAGATPRSDYIPDYSWQNDVKIGGIFDMPGPDHLPLMVPGGGMSMDGDAAVSQHPEALGAEAGKVGRGGRGFGRASLPRVAPAPAHMLGLHPMSRSHSTPNIPLLGEGGGAGGGLGMTRGLGGGALGKAGLGRIQGAAPIGSSSTNLPCVPAVAPHTLKANNRRGGQGRNSGRGSSLAVMTRSASLQPSDGRSGTPAMRGSGGGSLTQGPGAAHVGMGACGNDMGGMGFGAASGQACTKLGPGPTGGIVGVPAVGVGPVVGGNMARHVVPVGAGAGPQDETAQGGDGSDRIVNALAAQLEGMQRLQRFQAEQAKLQAQQLEQLRQALTRHMVAEPSL